MGGLVRWGDVRLVFEHDLDGDIRLDGCVVDGRGDEAVLADGCDGGLIDGGAGRVGDGDVLGDALVINLSVDDDKGIVLFVHKAVEGEGAADDVDESGGGGLGLGGAEVDEDGTGVAGGRLDGVGVEGKGDFIVHGECGGRGGCGGGGGLEDGRGNDLGLQGHRGSGDAGGGLEAVSLSVRGEDGEQGEGADKL